MDDLIGRHAVVTDGKRGIVAGIVIAQDRATKTVVLKDCRHCFYYRCHPGSEGILGLSIAGPADGSKIGPVVDLHEVFYHSITPTTEDARNAWETAKWG